MIKTYLIVFYFVPSRFFNVHTAAMLLEDAAGTLFYCLLPNARLAVQLLPYKRNQ
jgi:hypothetical protein